MLQYREQITASIQMRTCPSRILLTCKIIKLVSQKLVSRAHYNPLSKKGKLYKALDDDDDDGDVVNTFQ